VNIQKIIKKLENENFKSFREICHERKCNYYTVRYRLLKGYSIKDAFNPTIKIHALSLKQQILSKIKKLNVSPKISFRTIYRRIQKGFTIEQAIRMKK
jgi:hypothetical protein